MKVLLINGSPHKRGCTYTALAEVASALEQEGISPEIYHIGNKPVHGCQDCGACKKTQRCVFTGDVCNELIEKMQEADGIVIGSPVYFSGPNGALCALLDRVFFAARHSLRHKPSAAIVSCRRTGASAAFDRLNKYFTINQMPVASSQYWSAVHGYTPEDVKKDEEGLQIMRTLGRNMAWLLRSIQGNALPEQEPGRTTNFIS